MNFSYLDISVFAIYGTAILYIALRASHSKEGEDLNAKDYFLASKSLPWWTIAASLIATNISSQQFIGMSGSGFAIGLGISSYEWMSALCLLIVGKFFLPIYINKGIYTMPQFLEMRFSKQVRTIMAVVFLFAFILIDLTSVLYLGALALQTIMHIPLIIGILGIAIFAAILTIKGGSKAIAWTDVVQVVFLLGGGFITTYYAINAISDGHGFLNGLEQMYLKAPEKFHMILDKSDPNYKDLPGWGVLIGGMWIANLSFWGCNQIIIQRALAAKDLREAQHGVALAAYIKMLLPLIVVVPGIAAYVLHADISKPDEAYPWLLSTFLYPGIKGVAFSALIAAIVSTISGVSNTVSTVFTIDIYRSVINQEASDKKIVSVGRWVAFISLSIAVVLAPLMKNLNQVFQFIQEFGGFITPGYMSVIMFGLFWKKASNRAVIIAIAATIPLSFFFKLAFNSMPFLNRMGFVFSILCLIIVVFSLIDKRKNLPDTGIEIEKGLFKTSTAFNVAAAGVLLLLTFLYTFFW